MLDPEIEPSSCEAITSEDVERQIRAVIDPLTQQLAHLCELMKDVRDAKTHRHHEETASSRATSSSTGGTSWSDTCSQRIYETWKIQTSTIHVFRMFRLQRQKEF